MLLDVGYRRYSKEGAEPVYSFTSLVDYDPASSSVDDAVGEHYSILKAPDNQFLLYYRVRGQHTFASPAFTAAEGLVPLPADVAQLIIGRDRKPVSGVGAHKPKPFDAIVAELFAWLGKIESRVAEWAAMNEDFLNDLREMLMCLNANTYRACLAMAGVVLERLLKEFLAKRSINFEKDWMVGRLIGAVENSGQYVDPSLKNIWTLINAQRIIGVHAKEKVPIPSRDQALMVVFAVKDALTRILSSAAPEQISE